MSTLSPFLEDSEGRVESLAEPALEEAPPDLSEGVDLEDEGALPEAAEEADLEAGAEESEEFDLLGEETAEATETAGLPQELEAVDPFPAAERRTVLQPLLPAASSAKAVAWNAARHPAASRVDPATILAALARYVDLPAVQAAIQQANANGAAIAAGTAPVDAVFVEAVHQFQCKCYIEPKQADGLAGESTLDSLGVASPAAAFNTVDRVHAKTRDVLRTVDGEISKATGFGANAWFAQMENPAFLGFTFTNGIHAVLAKKLRIAERHLLAQPAFQGKTPAALGQALRIVEQHRGARPSQTTSRSMHTAGLAVDVNYGGNPWIAGNVDAPNGNRVFTDVMDRAALLMGAAVLGPEERLTPKFLHGLSSRPTSEIYAFLERYDRWFRDYFLLDGRLDGVRVRMLAHQLQVHADIVARMIRPGESVDAAARRWLRQIRDDREALKKGNFGRHREPRRGFLNLDRALVIALRDVAGLAWGAVDFGPNACGDIMHFDCRRDGIGRVIARALKKPYIPPAWTGEVPFAEEEEEEETFEGAADETFEGGLEEALALDGGIPAFEDAEGFFDTATTAIRTAWDTVKTRTRIANGIRDEGQLTNLVFFDRHPGRGGRRLTPGEPDFDRLRTEWLDIQARIVRPALAAAKSAGTRYDRAGALAYARKFWLRVCDDQFIALGATSGKDFVKVDPATRFEHEFSPDGTPVSREHAVLPDGTQIPWEHLDDCTHFISCCIGERPGEQCGGLKIPFRQLGSPPTAPYGIVRVSSMVDFLTGRWRRDVKYAEIVAEKSEDATLVSRLAAGDIVAYFNKALKVYSHMALLLGGGKIACHTLARSDQPQCTWDNDWDLGRGTHQWTFIRFVV